MYGPSSTQELYKSSESLSQWLTTGKATPKLPHGRNILPSASTGNLLALPIERLKMHGSTASVNSIPPKLPKRPTPRPSVTSVDFGSPRPSVTSLDIVTMSSLDDLNSDDLLTSVQRLKVALYGAVMFFIVVSLGTLALASVSISFSMTTPTQPPKLAVAAHLLINATALKAARVGVRPLKNVSHNMSSCQRAYELKYWHSSKDNTMLHGVLYNQTNSRLTILQEGIYSVYSQVVFSKTPPKNGDDPYSDSLIHVLCRAVPFSKNSDEDIAQATSTPNKAGCPKDVCPENSAFHTSHVLGVAHLYAGDEVYVKVSNLSVIHLHESARVTFVGLFKIN